MPNQCPTVSMCDECPHLVRCMASGEARVDARKERMMAEKTNEPVLTITVTWEDGRPRCEIRLAEGARPAVDLGHIFGMALGRLFRFIATMALKMAQCDRTAAKEMVEAARLADQFYRSNGTEPDVGQVGVAKFDGGLGASGEKVHG